MHTQAVVIVLAAGPGSRFDAPAAGHKLLQPLGPLSVLGTTLSNALASGLPVVLVASAALAGEAQRLLAARDVVVAPDGGPSSSQGLGDSMALGVSVRPHARGWVMLPGDMPMVQPATIRAVAAELLQHTVAYPQHAGRAGRPVGYAAELYSELMALKGDDAARRLAVRYPACAVEVHDPGVLLDVDTVDELQAMRARLPLWGAQTASSPHNEPMTRLPAAPSSPSN